MSEDEPFLRAILVEPDDRVSRLVYADWLDERADPKAEFIRIEARLTELPPDHEESAVLRRRRRELQAQLPAWWLAILGSVRATPSERGSAEIETVARMLGRPVQFVDDKGYTIT
ncbi:MAG: TIGR02996 domain-containing protein, partial [Planctomycetia bacterium]|nr:TIGR02996 domain-containing protein [Planctomycetia bacterium]